MASFYNFHDPLTGTWHRGYGFFEVYQAEGRGFESNFDQNFFVQVFFGFAILFFAIFLSPKGPPFIFSLFCKRMDVQKLPKAPLLHFSGLCDLPETKKISKKNSKKFKNFSSRGYCRKEYLTH